MEVETTVDDRFRPPSASHEDVDKSVLSPSHSANGCFDCYICLDFTVEPVVTLCGHLYCWPCIHKWLKQAEADSPQQCPVCKASLSRDALVPLYGRGHPPKPSHQDLKGIPRRPSAPRVALRDNDGGMSSILHHRQQQQQRYHHDRPYYNYPYASPASPRMVHSTMGGIAFAAMPWAVGNPEGVYYPGTPRMMTGGGEGDLSPRMRRQEMQLERLLHQIFLFFCFCVLLCLILF